MPVLDQVIRSAFGQCRVLQVEPLTGGKRNANFKVRLDTKAEWVVVRIYEHDASLCQKETDLIRLVGRTVRVPELMYAEPRELAGVPPFIVMQYVDGVSFRDLKHSGDKAAIAQAAFSVGETLAAIGRFNFGRPGWIAPGPTVTKPILEGVDATPRLVDLCLASKNLRQRLPEELCNRIHTLMWSWAPRFAELASQAHLVHGDFGRRNVLVRCDRDGKWSVAAVLDWEYAISGPPLADLGHFLRYERVSRPFVEPHFSAGYLHAGGPLPEEWRRLARLIDLTCHCESLTHDDLPDGVTLELAELVRATVEDRDNADL